MNYDTTGSVQMNLNEPQMVPDASLLELIALPDFLGSELRTFFRSAHSAKDRSRSAEDPKQAEAALLRAMHFFSTEGVHKGTSICISSSIADLQF